MVSCSLCRRERRNETGFCGYHLSAYENLRGVFDEWEKAVGVTWEGYLKGVIDREETGLWAREVALYLFQS